MPARATGARPAAEREARPRAPLPSGVIYLDNNATTMPTPEVSRAVVEMLTEHWHNPSSLHRPGQAARQKIELARRSVADLIGARPRELVFTSGATESINLALRGLMSLAPPERRTVITSPIEHEAVRDLLGQLASSGQITLRELDVREDGIVDASPITEGDWLDETVALVNLQWVNNETGIVQPIESVGRACRQKGIPFHVDGSQWVGRMPTSVAETALDLLSFTGHKFHAPKGVGGLYIRRGMRLSPQQPGAQELERRAGTENAPGIVGMGAAAQDAKQWLEDESNRARIAALRDRFERAVLGHADAASVNGTTRPDSRLWTTTNIAFPRLEAEALLLLLSERGVCASAGAACSSGSLDPSPILVAMGVAPERAHGSVRFSFSRFTTEREIDEAAAIVGACVARLSGSSAPIT